MKPLQILVARTCFDESLVSLIILSYEFNNRRKKTFKNASFIILMALINHFNGE